MSASFQGIGAFDKEVRLVQKITEKTKQGKLYWTILPSALSSSLSDGMQFSFVLPASFPPSVRKWIIFTVRDRTREMLKVEALPPLSGLLGELAGIRDLLRTAVDELFDAAIRATKGEIDKAIDKLDRI